MDAGPGGMPGLRTCIWLFLNPTLIVVVFCHCWNNADASSLLCEPPYTEPYVRLCGRTAEVTPPPTRLICQSFWLPPLDNLRNFFLTPTTEMLSFMRHLWDVLILPLTLSSRALMRKRLRVRRVTVVAHSGQSSQLR